MNKKAILSIIFTLVIICAVNATQASAAIANKLRVNLCGIKDADGSDRTGWQTVAYTWMSKLDANVYKRTAFDKNELTSYIKGADIFVIHTHGGLDYLKAVDKNGKSTDLKIYDVNSWETNCLSGLDLAYLGACECGKGREEFKNMVNSFFNKGARCVIGYEWAVDTKPNATMIQEFCRAIGAGYTIKNALAYADSKVLDKHGYPGWTHLRYVRGDTSVKFRNVTQLLSSFSTDGAYCDIPKDASEMVYFQNGEGIYGFFDPSKMQNEKSSERTMSDDLSQRDIADNYLKIYNQASDKYELRDNYYVQDTGLTVYIYGRKIHGIDTWDTVSIFINENGEIVSYSSPREGMFDDFDIEADTLNDADAKLQVKMQEMGALDYEIVGKMLILENGIPAVRFSVLHTVHDGKDEYDSIDDYLIGLED